MAAEDQKFSQHENSCAQQEILIVVLILSVNQTFERSVQDSEEGLSAHVVLIDSRNYQSVGHFIAFKRANWDNYS